MILLVSLSTYNLTRSIIKLKVVMYSFVVNNRYCIVIQIKYEFIAHSWF